jgi:hypothetical protein
MAFADLVADGIVLESEQSVQHLDTQPPIVANPVLGVPSSARGMKRRSLPTSSMSSLP